MPELKQFFEVSHVTVYAWFDAWEKRGITGLMNKPGRGRKPLLAVHNSSHVKAAIKRNPQSVKAVVTELEAKLCTALPPETLKRFLKNLVSRSAASAPVSSRGRWVLTAQKKKPR